MSLQIRETYVNQTKGYHLADWTPWYEPFTDNKGKLFRSLQREYGRCGSKMYIDTRNGETRTCGWVFTKKQQYGDTGRYGRPAEFYIQETWVEVRETVCSKKCFEDWKRKQEQEK